HHRFRLGVWSRSHLVYIASHLYIRITVGWLYSKDNCEKSSIEPHGEGRQPHPLNSASTIRFTNSSKSTVGAQPSSARARELSASCSAGSAGRTNAGSISTWRSQSVIPDARNAASTKSR